MAVVMVMILRKGKSSFKIRFIYVSEFHCLTFYESECVN